MVISRGNFMNEFGIFFSGIKSFVPFVNKKFPNCTVSHWIKRMEKKGISSFFCTLTMMILIYIFFVIKKTKEFYVEIQN